MNASGKLRIFILICVLFVTRSEVRSKKTSTSRLNIEESDGGSGDPVKKVLEKNVVPPDDTEASGEDGDDDEDSDGGSGVGSGSGSGALPTNITVKPTTIQTVVVINKGEGTTTVSTSIVDVTTKKFGVITGVDSNPKQNTTQTRGGIDPIIVDPEPDVAKSMTPDDESDAGLANSGVNFTVAIIVGVVVGAILSILIIVFLVYRLRKKDEGSYSLDEQSSAMLRADTDSPPPKGKEEYYA